MTSTGPRRRALVAAAVALVVLSTLAFTFLTQRSGSAKAQEQELRSIDRTQRQALVAADVRTLRRILAPDLRLVAPDGVPLTRHDYLALVASGGLDYRVFTPVTEVRVRLADDTAILTFASHLDVETDGGRREDQAWHTHVYQRRDGRWRMVWAQATTITSG